MLCREICNVVFKARTDVMIGNKEFKKNQPVLYLDTAKTSTLEGAATTVYAQGGRGNPRLIAWENLNIFQLMQKILLDSEYHLAHVA